MLPIEETDLAGIGTRYAIKTGNGDHVVIVVHDAGPVEFYASSDAASDPVPVAKFTEDEAKYLAAIVGRTIYRSEALERLNRAGGSIVWYEVRAGSVAEGHTAAELASRAEKSVRIVSVVPAGASGKGDTSQDSPLKAGDQIAFAGPSKQVQDSITAIDRGV